MTDDHEVSQVARIVLGGAPLNVTTDEIFARLEVDPRISTSGMLGARRTFDAMQIGIAVEALEKADDRGAKLSAMLRLARALRRHLRDRRPGWFRFLMAFGSRRGEGLFQLIVSRRPHSTSAQPKPALKRTTQSRQAISDMLIAGAILRLIETATARGDRMSIEGAIAAAINDEDILTQEEAARLAFQRFRKSCAQLTGGGDTYRLKRYAGPIKEYRGRWVALPDSGAGVSRLPSAKGGRRRT